MLSAQEQSSTIFVSNVGPMGTSNLLEVVTLLANCDDAKVTFELVSSSFRALHSQADNAVVVQVDVTATVTTVYLDGDYENSSSSDAINDVRFASILTVSVETLMTLESTTGSIVPAAELTLVAGSGVVVLDDMTTTSSNSPLVMDVDFESEGDGTLTVWAGKTVTSNKSDVTITAWDVVMDGSLTAGTETISVHGSKVLQTIGLGGTGQDMHIESLELQRISATTGLRIASGVNGSVTVNGIESTHSEYVYPLVTLIAQSDDTQVTFATTSSTFHTLAAQADNGVDVEVDVTATIGAMYLDGDYENDDTNDASNDVQFTDGVRVAAETLMTLESTTGNLIPAATLTLVAGSGVVVLDDMTTTATNSPLVMDVDFESEGDGTLTVWAGKTVTSNKSDVTITAWDVVMDGSLTAGTETISVHGSKVLQTIGLGGTGQDMHIESLELQRISATTGLRIASGVNGSVTVNGIESAHSEYVYPLVTLIAQSDDTQVTFATTSSTFHTLAAQADNGVDVEVDVTATTGAMYLDGDYENDDTNDATNDVQFTDGVRVAAETLLTLESTTGNLIPAATLTLVAGSGVVVLDDMTTTATNSPLVMDVDFESEGDGTLTVWAGKTVTSNKSDVTITAWDVVMDGSLTAGTETISVHGSKVLQTIGLGGTGQDMHIESLELQRISATTGLRIASGVNGSVTVNGIESTHSEYVYPLVTLIAQSDDTQVTFATTSSTFHTLAAQADNGVDVEVDVTATIGAMYLDGDYENDDTNDASNDVQFTDGVRVAVETLLTLESTTGNLIPAATLTLVAGSGVVVLDDMTTTSTNSPLVMDVDFESEGDGTVTVWAGKTVTSNKSDVTITAWDVVMDGSLTAGTETISVHGSKVLQTIGLGGTGQDMHIESLELQRISATTGLRIASGVNGSVTVNGIESAHSEYVYPLVTLIAQSDDTQVTFATTSSTFHTLAAQADNGVDVEVDVTATTGATYLDGDYENDDTNDATNDVQFTDGVRVAAETLLTLESTTGNLIPAARLTLVAGSGVVVLDDMTTTSTNSPLVMDVDFESEGDGTLTVWAGKTVTSNKSDVTITAWDVVMDGSLTAGTETISVHGSKVLQTIGLGGTGQDMHIESLELQRISATTGLRIASGVNGSVTVNGIESTHSEYVYPLVTLIAQSDDTQLIFSSKGSSFHTLAAQADNGVDVEVDVTATTATMYLDGDYENSSTGDTVNDVKFIDGASVSAETLLTLESTTGNLVRAAKLTLVAGSGVVLLDDMTTTASNYPLVMNADFESEGDGTLTVWAGKTVTSNKSDVTITAWDVVMDGSLTAGLKTISVHGSKVLQTIGLGGTGQDMHIESLELQRISATTGLRIASGVNGSVTVNGIESAHSEYVYPLVTLIAQSDDTQVTFATTSSTFHTLAAQADNGVDVEVDVTATIGAMYLDGDYENDDTNDASNDVQFTDALMIPAETLLTLESTTGNLIPAAKLTLVAGSGVVLLDDMTTTATNSPLVMDVDFESEGDGTLTVWAGKTVTSNKSDVTITAWDVVMDGSLTAGTETISVHGSKVLQTIGLGGTGQDMHIESLELQRMSATTGLRIASGVNGSVTVNGIESAHSEYVYPLVTLIAQSDDTQVTFATTSSTFHTLAAQADNAVNTFADVTTSAGKMYLDGDYENSSSADATNDVQFTDAVRVAAETLMTLESTTGNLIPAARLTLVAGSGVVLLDDMTTTSTNSPLVMDVDFESEGDGTLTVWAGKTVTSNKSDVTITAWDVVMDGSLTAGTETISMHGSKVLQTIGLGGTGQDMHIESLELQRISATTGLRIASGVNGSVTVNGIESAHSEYVYPLVTLIAQSDDTQVTFATTSSTFHTLAAQADNGVDVEVDVTATIGAMYLDGDYENDDTNDATNDVQFTDGVRVAAETLMTLESTTGNLIPAARLTLVAGSGVVVLDDMTTTATNSPLVMDVDFESEGDGTLTVWAGKTVTSNKSDVTITAWDVVMDGSLTAGTETISVHGSKVLQTIGLGGTGQDMHIESLELQRMSATTGLRIGDFSDSDFTVDGIESAHSEYVYPLVTLVAQSDDSLVTFSSKSSTFYALSSQADNGVILQVDVTTTSAGMFLDGDLENSSTADDLNNVQFATERIITSRLTLATKSTFVFSLTVCLLGCV